MSLETMTPDPTWDPAAHEEALTAIRDVDDRVTISVWCGDWCGDCRRLLPPFAASLEALGLDDSQLRVFSVEKRSDGSKVGDGVEQYRIERTPTVVVEIDGREVARFEEGRTEGPILESVAAQLEDVEAGPGPA